MNRSHLQCSMSTSLQEHWSHGNILATCARVIIKDPCSIIKRVKKARHSAMAVSQKQVWQITWTSPQDSAQRRFMPGLRVTSAVGVTLANKASLAQIGGQPMDDPGCKRVINQMGISLRRSMTAQRIHIRWNNNATICNSIGNGRQLRGLMNWIEDMM